MFPDKDIYVLNKNILTTVNEKYNKEDISEVEINHFKTCYQTFVSLLNASNFYLYLKLVENENILKESSDIKTCENQYDVIIGRNYLKALKDLFYNEGDENEYDEEIFGDLTFIAKVISPYVVNSLEIEYRSKKFVDR